VDFKPKFVRKDKGSHYILIKGIVHQETTVNICTLNIGTPNSIKQTLDIMGQRAPNITIVGDCNTALLVIDRLPWEKKLTKKIQSYTAP
jgi:hypothetical protein